MMSSYIRRKHLLLDILDVEGLFRVYMLFYRKRTHQSADGWVLCSCIDCIQRASQFKIRIDSEISDRNLMFYQIIE